MPARSASDDALHMDLRNYLRQINDATDMAQRVVAGLAENQIRWAPAAGRWSVAECVGHLNATNAAYLPIIEAAIREGRRAGLTGPGPYRHGWLVNWFIRSMEPPPRRRYKRPKVFTPEVPAAGVDVLPKFFAYQDDIVRCIRESDGLDLGRVRLVSPAARFLRMSLGQAFALLAAHERRHLWQARQVTEARGFPDVASALPPG